MPTLLLVDGSSYLYRAFHALPDLRTAAGEPTGAIRGVLSMLRVLEADYKSDYRAVVFDAKGKTFRDDWYPEYKAHRPSMPEDLAAQVEPLHECIRAAGWPLLMVTGVEADDVIGTLSTQAAAAGIDCVISTGDKDLAQLVNQHVTLVNTMSNETLDRAGVINKFGVPPERIVDYLALVGDTSDGVPGVSKVGPKTAVKWLDTWGSLDAIVAHASEIGGAVGENLRKHLDFLPLGVKLVTVVCDLPLPQTVTELTPQAPDQDKLAELYARLEFKGWLRELGGEAPPPAPRTKAAVPPAPTSEPTAHVEPDRSGYQCILDATQLDDWLARLDTATLVSLDTETTGLDPMQAQLVGISFAIAADDRVDAAYLPLGHSYAGAPTQLPFAETLARLKPWLESAQRPKLGQHLKYDRHIFANHGVQLRGIVEDTLLQSYVLESDKPHDLGSLAARHCALKTISYDDVTGKGTNRISFSQVEVARAAEYAAEDADVTLRVHRVLRPQLAAEPQLESLYRDLELPVAEVLFRIERNGVLIDAATLVQQSDELGRKIMALEAEAQQLAGQPFNLNSPKQLAEILFNQLGLPVVKKTPSGGPSTDEEVLEKLAEDYPLPKKILEHRSLAKLKNTYTDKLPKMINPATGRVHTSFGQATAVTGRLASTDPNLQNIPIRTPEGRRIRSAFVAPENHRIVSADYSQIELRIMAHLSDDPRLLEAFAQGEDVHRATAGEIFGVTPIEVSSEQRRAAKVINFGLIYGMSAFGLARQIGVDRSAAAAYMDRYFARYPGVARYMEETRAIARDKGYVETVFGRRLWLPEIKSSNAGRRQGAERAAINAPMQGTAADLIKRAMLAVQDWLDAQKLRTLMVLQVHDELVLEVPDEELTIVDAALPKLMGGVAKLKVPLLVEVGVGANWDAAH
ncbi:DNA polymerase I [Sulfuritalea hydrogenivorans]|uniref:DNA polymerase I n=1 Tax=Sulfuritalea hydrogenivorans sk43H TaxID=1223802 RepID=W0SL10_9PROT|nr:DNA polymerase I [Sulfuritalea hydrogenivorans]MDK9715986.1 DNA polymerase I [Sulfuritalea sp.]BAO31295.1 DNA polymerase A [Sulfuritalea hydrogenivorans sk43H]